MHLLKAIRTVARLESSTLRQEVFDDIAGRSAIIRLTVSVHKLCRHVGASHQLVALYGLSYYLRATLPTSTPRWLAIAYYPNETKQLDDIDALMGEDKPERVRWSFLQLGGVLALLKAILHLSDAIRFMRIFSKIEKKLRFMPACRVAETWFLYARFRRWLEVNPVRAIVVTSDYSPDAAALAAAAGSLGIKRIYMPHALPSLHIKGRTLLDYELYIFDSHAMRDRFAAMWPLTGNIVYRGVRGVTRPMEIARLDSKNLRIGILLSGPTDMNLLSNTIDGIRRLTSQRILLRGHPVSFSNPDFTSLERKHDGVHISRGTTLLEDADSCDLIIASNTTAFLETLKYGIASVYYSALDFMPYDYNGFVKDGLVSAIESIDELDIGKIKTFFAGQWEERMAYFDAAYGNDSAKLQQEVRQALLAVIG